MLHYTQHHGLVSVPSIFRETRRSKERLLDGTTIICQYMANCRVNCDLSPVAKLRCPCQVWNCYHSQRFFAEEFVPKQMLP